jgi:hypothetical protein
VFLSSVVYSKDLRDAKLNAFVIILITAATERVDYKYYVGLQRGYLTYIYTSLALSLKASRGNSDIPSHQALYQINFAMRNTLT